MLNEMKKPKHTFYFSHDFNARNDPKLQELLMVEGQRGIGVYWCLVEIMYEQGGKLDLLKCDSYAFALRVDTDCIQNVVRIAFKSDKKYFWSESVLGRIEKMREKSHKARASANARWSDANALQSQSDSNANKRKEKKINKSNKEKVKKENPQLDATALRLLEHYNLTFKRHLTPKHIDTFRSNLEYWLGIYQEPQIIEAITKAKSDTFWGNKLTLVILFRRKNPQGESVDHIDSILSRSSSNPSDTKASHLASSEKYENINS